MPQQSDQGVARMTGENEPATSASVTAPATTKPAQAGNTGGTVPAMTAATSAGQSGAPTAEAGSGGTSSAAGSGGHASVGGSASPAADGGSIAPVIQGLKETDTLIPHASWSCGMPDGIPAPKSGKLAFEVTLQLGEVYKLGRTQFGERVLTEIKGGTVKGDALSATIMDRGLDWQLALPNGVLEIEQVTVLRTDDGTNIFMRSCGTAPSADGEVRIVPDIEAPSSSRYSWLNDAKLVGTRAFDPAAKTMTLALYKVDSSSMPGTPVRIEEPEDLPNQSWDCAEAMGERDSVLYMASVMIDAGSISVGESKRGTRNIVPITGGTFSGRITGTVLPGGADFQLGTASDFRLDARYTLKTDDAELIIIRNCGTFTTAVPVYEAREDGPHAFLNKSKWLATGTGVGAGAVNMTIYEAKLP